MIFMNACIVLLVFWDGSDVTTPDANKSISNIGEKRQYLMKSPLAQLSYTAGTHSRGRGQARQVLTSGVPLTQLRTWSHTELAADRALENLRAFMIAAPRCWTVFTNSPSNLHSDCPVRCDSENRPPQSGFDHIKSQLPHSRTEPAHAKADTFRRWKSYGTFTA